MSAYPPGASGYAVAIITLLTGFMAWIAVRTVLLAIRGQFSRVAPAGTSPGSTSPARTNQPT